MLLIVTFCTKMPWTPGNQLAGDGSGCLTYELALAETDKLIGEGADHDGLLSRYRIYLQDRSARAATFRAQMVV